MSKLKKAIDKLEQGVKCDTCLVLINSLRKAIEQRDLCIYNQQAFLGLNGQKDISNKFDIKILQILEGENGQK